MKKFMQRKKLLNVNSVTSVLSMQGNQGYMKTFTEGENPLESKQCGNCYQLSKKLEGT